MESLAPPSRRTTCRSCWPAVNLLRSFRVLTIKIGWSVFIQADLSLSSKFFLLWYDCCLLFGGIVLWWLGLFHSQLKGTRAWSLIMRSLACRHPRARCPLPCSLMTRIGMHRGWKHLANELMTPLCPEEVAIFYWCLAGFFSWFNWLLVTATVHSAEAFHPKRLTVGCMSLRSGWGPGHLALGRLELGVLTLGFGQSSSHTGVEQPTYH